jgi:SAM-dependent methyltransferase
MRALETHYWWFQGRRDVLLGQLGAVIPPDPVGSADSVGRTDPAGAEEPAASASHRRRTIVDIGCGTGMLLEDLTGMGTAMGLDFSPVALAYCRGRRIARLARADACTVPLRAASVDLVTAIDIIEHIPDDAAVMAEIHRVLRPGGFALLSVPAHPGLWSHHDVALHHCRRYEKAGFRSLVVTAGLEPIRFTYAMGLAFLAASVVRRAKRLLPESDPSNHRTDEFPLPRPVNSLLRYLVGLEARYLKRRDMPFGLSILCMARKPR